MAMDPSYLQRIKNFQLNIILSENYYYIHS